MVNAAYGDQALTRPNVFQWYGREDIEDNPRSGRPTDFYSHTMMAGLFGCLYKSGRCMDFNCQRILII